MNNCVIDTTNEIMSMYINIATKLFLAISSTIRPLSNNHFTVLNSVIVVITNINNVINNTIIVPYLLLK